MNNEEKNGYSEAVLFLVFIVVGACVLWATNTPEVDPETIKAQNVLYKAPMPVGSTAGWDAYNETNVQETLDKLLSQKSVEPKVRVRVKYHDRCHVTLIGFGEKIESGSCPKEIPLQQFVDLIMETNGLYYEPETTSTTKARLVK